VRAHGRARERQADGDAVGRVDERVRELAADLRLGAGAQTRVDAASLVGLEEHAGAVGPAREGRALAARQHERQRAELRSRRQGRIDAGPVDRVESRARAVVHADEPVVATARARLLAGEDDVVGQEQARHSVTLRGLAP